MEPEYVSPDAIRDRFSKAMSLMYQQEVPQYGTLLNIVRQVNEECLDRSPDTFLHNDYAQAINRLSVERHGAIRLGSASELNDIRQMFSVMGMYPVSYYDLSAAGVPVHATAFRPITEASLAFNPFRIFTSLLRLELIDDPALRDKVAAIIARRHIFTPRALELIAENNRQGGLKDCQAAEFVSEVLETFRWHHHSPVDRATYQQLLQQHRLIADVVCFKGPHINHLTPRTLDIDEVQRRMPQQGIAPKETIEGPPARRCPILLRQTSFKALSEKILFADQTAGTHTARFGEIEQRGQALTPKGRALYDKLLLAASAMPSDDNVDRQAQLAQAFADFPDDIASLRQQELGFFRYLRGPNRQAINLANASEIGSLIASGHVLAEPIIYEDFLPVSAAGIFQSNLDGDSGSVSRGNPDKATFEAALGCGVIDEFTLYATLEQASLQELWQALEAEQQPPS